MDQKTRKRGPKVQTEITLAQRQTFTEIENYIRRHERAPTIAELAALLGIGGTSAAQQVNQLVRKGYLKRTPGVARGLTIARSPAGQGAAIHQVPLVGTVVAGWPKLSEENVIGEVWIEAELVDPERCIALKVEGESMSEAGIHDGDLVVVRRQPLAESGDIVVALVDGDATVKRLYMRDNVIELRPDSKFKKFRPIAIGPGTDLQIVGKVVVVRGTNRSTRS